MLRIESGGRKSGGNFSSELRERTSTKKRRNTIYLEKRREFGGRAQRLGSSSGGFGNKGLKKRQIQETEAPFREEKVNFTEPKKKGTPSSTISFDEGMQERHYYERPRNTPMEEEKGRSSTKRTLKISWTWLRKKGLI